MESTTPHSEWRTSIAERRAVRKGRARMVWSLWVPIVILGLIGPFWGGMIAYHYTGNPSHLSHLGIVPMTMSSAIPLVIYLRLARVEPFSVIPLGWTALSLSFFAWFDMQGLSVFGALPGWWWVHYLLGAIFILAPSAVHEWGTPRVERGDTFGAMSFFVVGACAFFACTGCSEKDVAARYVTYSSVGMTGSEFASVQQGAGLWFSEGRWRYWPEDWTDVEWDQAMEPCRSVEGRAGNLEIYYQFESGRLARVHANFD